MGIAFFRLSRKAFYVGGLSFVLVKCAGLTPDSFIRAANDPERLRKVATWAGTYEFSECDKNGKRCQKYLVLIRRDGTAEMGVDEQNAPRRIEARGISRKDRLTLQFQSYLDSSSLAGLAPDFTFGFGSGLKPGERMVALEREKGRKVCMYFEQLKSTFDSEKLCIPAPDAPENISHAHSNSQ